MYPAKEAEIQPEWVDGKRLVEKQLVSHPKTMRIGIWLDIEN